MNGDQNSFPCDCVFYVATRESYLHARALPVSEADILSPVDVIRLIPLSGGIEARRRGEQCYGRAAARAFLHRARIALGVTTRGCGAIAPDTFPCRRRRINLDALSPEKKRSGGRGCKKGISSRLPWAKRYIPNAIVIGERQAAFSILRRPPTARENLRAGEKLFAFQIIRSDIRYDFTSKMFNFTLTSSRGDPQETVEKISRLQRKGEY